jgi:berberine-like enzyme
MIAWRVTWAYSARRVAFRAPDNGANHQSWARALFDRLARHALPGGYPNPLAPEEHERVRLAYGPNFQRLLQLKRRFDPDAVFTSATPTLPAADTWSTQSAIRAKHGSAWCWLHRTSRGQTSVN